MRVSCKSGQGFYEFLVIFVVFGRFPRGSRPAFLPSQPCLSVCDLVDVFLQKPFRARDSVVHGARVRPGPGYTRGRGVSGTWVYCGSVRLSTLQAVLLVLHCRVLRETGVERVCDAHQGPLARHGPREHDCFVIFKESLCTVYYNLCTVNCIQCNVISALCVVYCVLCTVYTA